MPAKRNPNAAQSRLPLSFALALSLVAGQAQALQDCEVGGKPVNLDNGSTTAGLTGVVRCVDRDTRRPLREMEIRNGEFIGLQRSFEANGARRERSVNARGNTDGWARNYAANGTLIEESQSRDGTRIGLSRAFFADGKPKVLSYAGDNGRELARVEFNARGQVADLRCGPEPLIDGDAERCGFGSRPAEVTTYREDGGRSATMRLEAGKLVAGSWYNRDGTLARSEQVQGNERTERIHHPSGAVRREQVSDLARRERVAEREFAESGTKVSEVLYRDAMRASEATWYLNGQPRERITWSREGARRIAQVESFNDAGVKTFIGSRDDRGRPMGLHRNYDARGTLRLEQSFDDSGRPTRRREFDESGRLSADDEVFPDGSRRAFSR